MISFLLALASPFIAHVYEYRPAPGQFVNEAPEYEAGDTYADILAKAEEQLCGEATPGLVSLGAFGGYIVFGFDHPVANVEGEPDFNIYGNAISNGSEPGIVSVSIDANGNGLPDDPWYELAGSEYESEGTVHDFTITYRQPEPGHKPVPDPDRKFVTDAQYCLWTSSDGTSGYVVKTEAHDQPYWPQWLGEGDGTLTFTATRLAPNGVDRNGKGTNYDITPYAWGYADNRPNTSVDGFDLGNARDAAGHPVRLSHADFIRVHTAVNQQLGWLGESSTEVAGAEDLHPEVLPDSGVAKIDAPLAWRLVAMRPDGVEVECSAPSSLSLHSPEGTALWSGTLAPGRHLIPLAYKGIVILTGEGRSVKLVK